MLILNLWDQMMMMIRVKHIWKFKTMAQDNAIFYPVKSTIFFDHDSLHDRDRVPCPTFTPTVILSPAAGVRRSYLLLVFLFTCFCVCQPDLVAASYTH